MNDKKEALLPILDADLGDGQLKVALVQIEPSFSEKKIPLYEEKVFPPKDKEDKPAKSLTKDIINCLLCMFVLMFLMSFGWQIFRFGQCLLQHDNERAVAPIDGYSKIQGQSEPMDAQLILGFSPLDRAEPSLGDIMQLFERNFDFYLNSLQDLRMNSFFNGPNFGFGSEFERIGHEVNPLAMFSPELSGPSIPDFCLEANGLSCSIFLDAGDHRIVIVKRELNFMPLIQNHLLLESMLPMSWHIPEDNDHLQEDHEKVEENKDKPLLVAVHSQKDAELVKKHLNTDPKILPLYCPESITNKPEKLDMVKSKLVLFPGPQKLKEKFTTCFNNASDSLDIAASLYSLNEVLEGKNMTKGNSKDIKAIIFPTRDIPEDTLHHIQCLNIPMFVPLFNFRENETCSNSGSSGDELTEEIMKFAFHNEFPNIVYFNSYYDLIEKLYSIKLDEVKEKMWKNVLDKNQKAKEQVKELKTKK